MVAPRTSHTPEQGTRSAIPHGIGFRRWGQRCGQQGVLTGTSRKRGGYRAVSPQQPGARQPGRTDGAFPPQRGSAEPLRSDSNTAIVRGSAGRVNGFFVSPIFGRRLSPVKQSCPDNPLFGRAFRAHSRRVTTTLRSVVTRRAVWGGRSASAAQPVGLWLLRSQQAWLRCARQRVCAGAGGPLHGPRWPVGGVATRRCGGRGSAGAAGGAGAATAVCGAAAGSAVGGHHVGGRGPPARAGAYGRSTPAVGATSREARGAALRRRSLCAAGPAGVALGRVAWRAVPGREAPGSDVDADALGAGAGGTHAVARAAGAGPPAGQWPGATGGALGGQ